MRKFIVFVCAAAIVIILFNMFYECNHRWEEATCQVPKTCAKCGETEGDVIPHNWEDTNCVSPSPCTMCGTLEGIELTHEWQADGSRLCKRCGLDERPMDVRFVESLGKSLDKRWEIMGEAKWYTVKERGTWDRIVRAERELLEEFRTAHFEDENLGAAAIKYIEGLDEIEAALVNFGTEEWESAYYNSIRHKQNDALYKISLDYDISVRDENGEKLAELIESGKTIAAVDQLINELRIHDFGGYGDLHNYDVIMENTTDITFERFVYTIEFFDKDQEIILTKKFTIYDWEPGEKITRKLSINGGYAGYRVSNTKWE